METDKRKCRILGCGTIEKHTILGQISELTAFRSSQLLVTWLVLVTGL